MSIKYLNQEKWERAKKAAGKDASEESILNFYKKFGGAFEGEVSADSPKEESMSAPAKKGRGKK